MKKIFYIAVTFIIVLIIYNKNQLELFIPDSSIRLRIIPNSNKEKDIYIKEQVKEYLEKSIYQDLKNTSTIEEARKTIQNDIPNIENKINNIFLKNEYKENFKINFGYNYFPEKEYLNKKYKEGYYESLVITIGKGSGDNWWCALFPNFCLLDLEEDTEYESYIYNLLEKLF